MKKNIIAFIIALFVISCSSSSENDEKRISAPKLPTNETLEVTLPTEAPAQEQIFAGFSNIGSAFIGIYGDLANGSVKDGVYSWSVNAEGKTITVYAKETSNGDFGWEFRISGTDSENQIVFDDWLFMSGTATADGKSGSWIVYDLTTRTNTATMTAEWSINSNGSITTSVTTSGNSTDEPTTTYMVQQNTDGSGSLIVKYGTTTIYTCTW